jgi:hypothetical protein
MATVRLIGSIIGTLHLHNVLTDGDVQTISCKSFDRIVQSGNLAGNSVEDLNCFLEIVIDFNQRRSSEL